MDDCICCLHVIESTMPVKPKFIKLDGSTPLGKDDHPIKMGKYHVDGLTQKGHYCDIQHDRLEILQCYPVYHYLRVNLYQ